MNINNFFTKLKKMKYLKIKAKILTLAFLMVLSNTLFSQDIKLNDITKNVKLKHFAFDPIGMTGGIGVIDFDNDGFEDLYFTSGLRKDILYKNINGKSFEEVTTNSDFNITAGLMTNGVAIGDIDNDGLDDIIVATGNNKPDLIFINEDNGKFKNISESAGITTKSFSTSVTLFDINNDGLLDIYFGNYSPNPGEPCHPNILYINKGNRKFQDESLKWGLDDSGCTLATIFTDLNNDGVFELFVGNDFGNLYGPNRLFFWDSTLNKYIDKAEVYGVSDKMSSMGIFSGDYDNDGFFDYYLTNIDSNKFYKNNGGKKFSNITINSKTHIERYVDTTNNSFIAPTSWGGGFIDLNHDTFLDLVVVNGHLLSPSNFPRDSNKIYKNLKNGSFEDVSNISGFNSPNKNRGCAYFDFDNDGDMDIVTTSVVIASINSTNCEFYENVMPQSTNTNWIKIKLVGSTVNRNAIGSKINVFIKDKKYSKEIHGGGDTYFSQNTLTQHFGLADNNNIDSIEIIWRNGERKKLRDIKVNQYLNIIQDYFKSVDTIVCRGTIFKNRVINKNEKFNFNYTAKNGADSIVTYNVGIREPVLNETILEFCEGDVFENQRLEKGFVTERKGISYEGCDSIFRRVVKVNPAPKDTKNISICFGERYKGVFYNKSIKLEERVKNNEGCDSLITINLNILPSPKFEETKYVCSGYLYFETKIVSDTTIIDYFKTGAGCDSVYLRNFKVEPIKKFEQNISINFGEYFEEVLITNDTTITKKLRTDNGCDSLFVVNVKMITSIYSEFNNNKINIYPNPFEDNINIDLTNIFNQNYGIIEVKEIKIINVLGETIFTQNEVIYNNKIISLTNLNNLIKNQVYFLTLNINNKYYTLSIFNE